MDIRHYTIALNVDPLNQYINGYTTVRMKLSETTPVIVLDFWHGITTEKVEVNGRTATFAQ